MASQKFKIGHEKQHTPHPHPALNNKVVKLKSWQ
jgi:hypothetical protein